MLWRLLRAAFEPRSSAALLVSRALDLRGQGHFAEAERVLRSAVERYPGDAVAATNLAVALLEQDRGKEAVGLLERAIESDPHCAAAHFNYAHLLRVTGRLPEAITHYRAAKTADPQFAAAPEELMQTLLEACDWDGAQAQADELRGRIAHTPPSVWMRYMSPLTATYLGLAREQCKAVATFHAERAVPQWGGAVRGGGRPRSGDGAAVAPGRAQRERIRIGYFSRDFRDHPIGHVLRGVFSLHDRSRFAIHAFSFGPDDRSEYRRIIANSVDVFVDLAAHSDEQAARTIAAAGIDILVDLMGHTTGNRLGVLARRPAPVQAHYLGYAGTTGAPYIDYFLSDEIVTPQHLHADFSEELAYIPECFMVSDGTQVRGAISSTRSAEKLPGDGYVFANFGNSSRITREVFGLWMQILRAVPGSVLWLKRAHTLVVENLEREARTAGVDAQRLIFAERLAEKTGHLGRLALADLALDTIGWYNGHSSSADMLWAGVPVLTAPGDTFASRVAASLVGAAGLQQWIAKDAEEYVATAVRLGTDPAQSAALRSALGAARASAPFFDTAHLVWGLETAYEAMFAAKMHRSAGL